MVFSIIFSNFAIVIEITIATIGCGSEKPEQAQFSLALHDGCIIENKREAATRCSWFARVSNTIKNTTKGMIELYLSKVSETSQSELAGKIYARVDYKQELSVQDMAKHMAEHNTSFSEGTITGILIDFVKCIREQVLMGNTVKINNLAIFKATVEGNGLDTLYDAQADKVVTASIGTLKDGDKTGPAVKVIKLLAQSTGDFTREELKKDVKFSFTDKTKAEIAAAKGESGSSAPSGGSSDVPGGGSSDIPGSGGTTPGEAGGE